MKLYRKIKRIVSKNGNVVWFFPYEIHYHKFIAFDKRFVNRWFHHTNAVTHIFGFRFSQGYGQELIERRITLN